MIETLPWVVTIGRFDIQTAMMTLSSFRFAPRCENMERMKHIYDYHAKMKHAITIINTNGPDFFDLPTVEFDWRESVYGDVKELFLIDAPVSCGKYDILTHYDTIHLMHCILLSSSVTFILNLLNKTSIDWHAKK